MNTYNWNSSCIYRFHESFLHSKPQLCTPSFTQSMVFSNNNKNNIIQKLKISIITDYTASYFKINKRVKWADSLSPILFSCVFERYSVDSIFWSWKRILAILKDLIKEFPPIRLMIKINTLGRHSGLHELLTTVHWSENSCKFSCCPVVFELD